MHLCPDGSYVISRYDDLVRVYRDHRHLQFRQEEGISRRNTATHPCSNTTRQALSSTTRRSTRGSGRLIVGALTPRAIAQTEPGLINLVDGLLDAMAARGEVDLISDFAAAIPVEVIGNLLAVPREEREPLRDWSLAILGALEPVLTPDQEDRGNEAVTEFLDYLQDLVADRRKAPGDPDVDVLTRLILGEGGMARS